MLEWPRLDRERGGGCEDLKASEGLCPRDGCKFAVDVLMFPLLDHGQIFRDSQNRKRVVELISSYCSK